MSRMATTWRLRAGAALLLLVALAITAAFPRPAWTACGPLDLGACVDNAEYSFYHLIASTAWNVNRWLLLLAYQLDQLRAWLITVAFTSAYQWLTSFIQPVYVPVATAALMLAAILFMLVPITGETGFINLRHVLVWAVLTPLVLTVAGQLIGQAEQVRSDVSARLFAEMSRATPGAIFGAPGSDMPAPVAIYPANPCGTTLARATTTGIAMDALAAALLYADAGDIHCPDARGPSRDIPDGFYNSPPAYAYDGYVGDLDSSVERRGWVEGMQRGMNRLLQGIIPSFLAVLESLIHLIFSLSMAVLWLSLPIGLIFVWFQQTASPVSTVLRRAAALLIVSWMSSLIMGVLSAALVAAAALGNAAAYTGMAFGALFLMGYLCLVAFSTLWKSIATVEQTALSVVGMSLTQPLQTAAQLTTTAAAGAAAGVMSGGAAYLGLAAAGSAAFAQSDGGSLGQRAAYTASAMVGRLPGAGAIGEVAAAMGWLDTEGAVYEGVYAGERSHHGWRSARLQMERDSADLHAAAAPPTGGGSAGSSSSPPSSPAQHFPRRPSAPPPGSASGGGRLHTATALPLGAGGAHTTPTVPPPSPVGSTPVTSATTHLTPSVAGLPAGAPSAPSAGAAALGAGGSTVMSGSATPPRAPGASGALGAVAQLPPTPPHARAASGAQEPVAQLSPTNLHAAYAGAQIGSLPNPATGADWQYVGSIQSADGYRHAFQHPAHPLTNRVETRWVVSTAADVAAAQAAQTKGHP